jgi:hypothetical protein
MLKITKRFLHAAHLGAAITVGLAVTGLDQAPVRTVAITTALGLFLFWSYKKLYPQPKYMDLKKPNSSNPIDDAVRRDLGIEG